MKENCVFVGIDTSNYTTSVALADASGQVVMNEKQLLSVAPGARGLRQSDALFAHTKNLPEMLECLRERLNADGASVGAVGFSATPRRAPDSYMPCFLAGRACAYAMATTVGGPLYSFSHQEGHLMAALYSGGKSSLPLRGDWIAFHVSGGTTDVMLVHPDDDGLAVQLLGRSLDLHAGQAIDRIGVAMGLSFPCGKDLERLSDLFQQSSCSVPKPKICTDGMNCHLSGLENLALSLYRATNDKCLTARFTLDFLAETLLAMAEAAKKVYPGLPLLFAGGVMSNRYLQERLENRFGGDACFSAPNFSADNAAGIALLCRRRYWMTQQLEKDN